MDLSDLDFRDLHENSFLSTATLDRATFTFTPPPDESGERENEEREAEKERLTRLISSHFPHHNEDIQKADLILLICKNIESVHREESDVAKMINACLNEGGALLIENSMDRFKYQVNYLGPKIETITHRLASKNGHFFSCFAIDYRVREKMKSSVGKGTRPPPNPLSPTGIHFNAKDIFTINII
ncbi:hypothetical protein PMAYCL1PPCAC_18805 [Pristionchus mayeri]|uniref:Uncharacterized protein n=1 Tax=Pristionchus mayeri TaxID=1317129 RepID=A0AAN5CQK7_9BILA|nr:hypothetical protein PMAYCL1PPCAC_18805 [Pristionchus mayeri]